MTLSESKLNSKLSTKSSTFPEMSLNPSTLDTTPLADSKILLKSKLRSAGCPPSKGFHFSVCGQIFSGLHNKKSKIDMAKSIISFANPITLPIKEEIGPKIALRSCVI